MRKLIVNPNSGDIVLEKGSEKPLMLFMDLIITKSNKKAARCIWFEDDIMTSAIPVDELIIAETHEWDVNAQQIAQWMRYAFERTGRLSQKAALAGINKLRGEKFIIKKPKGGLSIEDEVRDLFIELTHATWNGNYGRDPRWERSSFQQ